MKIYACIAALACCAQGLSAQTVIRGRVCDSSDHSGLSYARIGIEARNAGTLSDADGNFAFTIADTVSRDDSLTFSYIGYAPLKRRISDFDLSGQQRISLLRETYEIPEVVVRPGKTKQVKMGRGRNGSDLLSTSFFSGSRNPVGEECGVLLNCKHDCTVNRLCFFLKKNGFGYAKFRLNFYSVKDGVPDEALGDRDIQFDISDRYVGWVDLDLSGSAIRLKPGDFAVTMTFLEGKAADSSVRGFEMPITLLSKNSVVSRDNAMGRWGRDQMMIALFVEATAYVD